jgi:hypothetical protein
VEICIYGLEFVVDYGLSVENEDNEGVISSCSERSYILLFSHSTLTRMHFHVDIKNHS